MTDERRYDEREADEIFAIAAESPSRSGGGAHAAGGLTLHELQAIGREAGIPAERIAEAAHSLELRGSAQPRKRFLGVPISVGRTVELPRALTDHEWEVLVAELRQTFGARGRVESHGSLRAWTNGNLHVYVEPTASGHQLRLGTRKGDGIPLTLAGLAGAGFTAWMALRLAPGGDVADVAMMGLMSAVAIVLSFGRLPRWARAREEQMEHIALRTFALASASTAGDQLPRGGQ